MDMKGKVCIFLKFTGFALRLHSTVKIKRRHKNARLCDNRKTKGCVKRDPF
jgi:hypothetical protein